MREHVDLVKHLSLATGIYPIRICECDEGLCLVSFLMLPIVRYAGHATLLPLTGRVLFCQRQ